MFSDKTVFPAISVIQDIGEIVSVVLIDIINSTFSAILRIVSVFIACHVLVDVCVCVACCPSATSSLSRCVFLGLSHNEVKNNCYYHGYEKMSNFRICNGVVLGCVPNRYHVTSRYHF
jgi:hypothetical protein